MADEKELKDQRVPIMMTPSELEAIDNWMFANRIRSRGEAIRRLCQTALGEEERDALLRKAILEIIDALPHLPALVPAEKQKAVVAPILAGTLKAMYLSGNKAGVLSDLRTAPLAELASRSAYWAENLKKLRALYERAPHELIEELGQMMEAQRTGAVDDKPNE
jgi:hypothetical protein